MSTLLLLETSCLLIDNPDLASTTDSGSTTGSGSTTDSGSTTTTTTTMSSSSGEPTSAASASTASTTSTSTGVDETSTNGTTSEEPAGPFVFDATPFDQYSQIDRMGFPLVNTGLNLLGDKDGYNAATPDDDAALMFAINIFESLETLHLGLPGMQTPDNTGLDDDWAALGIQPCVTPPLPMDTCDNQIGSYAIPDTLVIDLDDPAGFPNGRALPDPVADIIFAIILLDLQGGIPITTFLDIPLNPTENDVAFPNTFPYLAPAHQ